MINKKLLSLLPLEIVDEIADYHDYEKYCKPKHQENLKDVLKNIFDMNEIMSRITPTLAWQCWGAGTKFFIEWNLEDNIIYDDENLLDLI